MTGATKWELRVSDADRESAVELLHRGLADGRYGLEEFDRRTAAAYRASTVRELVDVTGGLPGTPLSAATLHAFGAPPGRPAAAVPPPVAVTPWAPRPVAAAPWTPAPAPAPQPSGVLARFGPIVVADGMVHTPQRSFPLAGTRWEVVQRPYTYRRTPRWAVLLAVLGFFVVPFVSLLFLLCKETRVMSDVDVWVGTAGYGYGARLAAVPRAVADATSRQVGYVRTLT